MKTAIWISWSELIARKFRLLLNITLVCLAVGFCISIELLSKSREQAVETEINFVGPAIRITPAGVSAADLIRFEPGNKLLPETATENLVNKFSSNIYTAEGRLLLKKQAGNSNLPIIGIDPKRVVASFKSLKTLGENETALGIELARELNKKEGDTIQLGEYTLKVKKVLQSAANVDDAALFINLPLAQKISGFKSGINVIRVFPRSGISTDKLTAELKAAFPDFNITKATRSDVAENKLESKLQLYRNMLYVFTGLIMVIALMIGAYLNGNERRLELATLFAIGSTGNTVLLVLVLRAIIVGVIGSALGYATGAVFALIQDFNSAAGVAWSIKLFLTTTGITVAISIMATVPVSIAAGFRNHVMVLQEE